MNYSLNSLRWVELPCNNRQFREGSAGTLLFKDYASAMNQSSESLSILCASKPLNMAVISRYLNISLRCAAMFNGGSQSRALFGLACSPQAKSVGHMEKGREGQAPWGFYVKQTY